jgi:hypothetical protein
MKRILLGILVVVLCYPTYAGITLVDSQLSFIDAAYGNERSSITGIDGDHIVGNYFGGRYNSPYGESGGFSYNINTGDVFRFRVGGDPANPPSGYNTRAKGISGNNIVGVYDTGGTVNREFSFIKPLDSPVSSYTALTPWSLPEGHFANGIYGSKIVGMAGIGAPYTYSGFLYDGTSTQYFSAPNSLTTLAKAIYGDKIIGTYTLSADSQNYGYVYDGSSFQTLSKSDAYLINPTGIYGDIIVGSLYESSDNKQHGFIYDGTNWTLVDVAGSIATTLTGVSGNTVTGTADGKSFVATNAVPEPSALSLLAVGLGGLALVRRRRS